MLDTFPCSALAFTTLDRFKWYPFGMSHNIAHVHTYLLASVSLALSTFHFASWIISSHSHIYFIWLRSIISTERTVQWQLKRTPQSNKFILGTFPCDSIQTTQLKSQPDWWEECSKLSQSSAYFYTYYLPKVSMTIATFQTKMLLFSSFADHIFVTWNDYTISGAVFFIAHFGEVHGYSKAKKK